MPTQKDLKRLVRSRMKKTGESYTAARTRLLEKRPPAKARKPAARSAPVVDFAALAGISDAAVAKKTGRTWREWVALLDDAGAAKLPHAAIAKLLYDEHAVPGWWAQTVAVGYERIRGLRAKGQQRDGSYAVTKSKVYPVPLAELWTGFCRCDRWLDGKKLRMRGATKHKYMHMRWSDGTPVDAVFYAVGPAKSRVQLQHTKLASRAEAERLRVFWGECLARLASVIADRD